MKEVAKAAGVSEATVSRWEGGDIAKMKRSKIYSLAKILKISPVSLLVDTKENPAPSDWNGVSEADMRLLNAIHSLPADRQKALLQLLGIE